jgi:hypothetical protein
MTIQRSSSSSKRVRICGSKKAARGGRLSFQSTLGPRAIRKYRENAQTDFRNQLEGKTSIALVLALWLIVSVVMGEDERRTLDAIWDLPEDYDDDVIDVDDVLDGIAPIDISHVSGEFQAILEDDLRKEGR